MRRGIWVLLLVVLTSGANTFTRSWTAKKDLTPKRARKREPGKQVQGRGRCMISNESDPSCAVEVCHFVARATPDRILTGLEYLWGLDHCSFNVDTSKNLYFLVSYLRTPFDRGWWFLLPTASMIAKLYHASVYEPCRVSTLYDNQTLFEYDIMPTPRMNRVVIHRRVDSDEQNAEDAHIAHRYPFASLSPFLSHIQPHFVVFNTGQKLSESSGPDGSLPPLPTDRIGDLLLCRQLYEIWSRTEVPREFYGVPSSSSHGRSAQRSDKDLARDLLDEEDRARTPG